ncbi:unnamed protein product, partial [Iphiclides podalirius]
MPSEAVYSLYIKRENAHEDPIYSCAWTQASTSSDPKAPKKDFIATGGLDCLVKVWQVEKNKLEILHELHGHAMAVMSVAVSPDGHTLATVSIDSTLIIWDLVSGNKVHEIQSGATDMWKVAFSPDGTQVVSGSHSGKILIYGIEKGIVDRVLDTRGKFAVCVDWSSDGKYICSGAVDGTVCIFNVAQGKLIHTVEAHAQTVRSVAFSQNSQSIVTASNDGYVKVYNAASANFQCEVNLKSWVLSACFSKEGRRVAAATADGCVHFISLDNMNTLKSFKEHANMVCEVQFNPAGVRLVSVSKDKCINIYECPVPPKQSKK